MSLGHQEQITAATLAATSGGSFVTAHWFLVTDQLLHFGAGLISVVTGIAALVFYIQGIVRRFKDHG